MTEKSIQKGYRWRVPLVLGCLFLFLLLGGMVYRASFHKELEAQLLTGPTPPNTVRTTMLVSGEDSLHSLHFKKPCVAFHLQVVHHYETTDESGSPVTRDTLAFELSRGPDEIVLRSGKQDYLLPRDRWKGHYHPRQVRVETCPVYVPEQRHSGKNAYFEVQETLLARDQKVFVAAALEGDRLDVDPELGELLVYPGTKAECVAEFRRSASTQRIVGIVLAGIGVLVSAFLWKASGTR